MDVAIYSRISTDKQDNQNQLEQLREFAAGQGWRIKREYVDIATGKNSDREQFRALFKAASRREFELVLFWSLDRFSREGVLETLTYLQNLTQYGVGYRSFTEQYLDSCGMFREAVISILAVIAKQERVRLSERTIAGLQRARARGRIGGRPRAACDPSEIARLKTDGKTSCRNCAHVESEQIHGLPDSPAGREEIGATSAHVGRSPTRPLPHYQQYSPHAHDWRVDDSTENSSYASVRSQDLRG